MFCDESKGFRKEGGGEGEEVAVRVGEGVNPLVFFCSSLFSTFCLSLFLSLPSLFLETSHSRESGQHAHEDSVYQALASYFSLLFMILKHKRVVQGEAELSTELLMHCVDIVDI